MKSNLSIQVKSLIKPVKDFPKSGVTFYDIQPLLFDPEVFNHLVHHIADQVSSVNPTKILAIESRGFILGTALSLCMELPLILVRKQGKLPNPLFSASYTLEYGEATLEISQPLSCNDSVLVVDDVLATGGTASAVSNLISNFRVNQKSFFSLITISSLQRTSLPYENIFSYLTF